MLRILLTITARLFPSSSRERIRTRFTVEKAVSAEEKKADSLLNLPADKVKEVMYNFIDQVLVYDDKNIKVKWNFADGLGMVS